MRTRLKRLTFIATTLALYCSATLPIVAKDKLLEPEPIPPGYDFPADRNLLQNIADRRDVKAAREHAWQVWLGMNQPSRISSGGDTNHQYLPIWETWYAEEEITDGITKPITPKEVLKDRTQPPRKGKIPHQLKHLSAEVVVSFNKFNPAAGKFIMDPHYHDTGVYYYNVEGDLKKLNDSFPENTKVTQRTIEPFPPRAMETKPVFMLVKASGLTAIPFWQGPIASVNHAEPTPSTWTTCVLIDPTEANRDLTIRPATEAQSKSAQKQQAPNCSSYLYAGLDQIYHYELTTSAAAKDFHNEQGGMAEKGDYAVLVAMHINTKEITNWTWQTFFWSGGESPPNDFPGDMSNQPVALQTPWDNYAMCTAYWQEELDGSVKTCFNPYLETATSGIPDGLNSNCMSCHGTARTAPLYNNDSPVAVYPQNYIRGIGVGPEYFSETYFRVGDKGNTRTDFSWALGSIPQN